MIFINPKNKLPKNGLHGIRVIFINSKDNLPKNGLHGIRAMQTMEPLSPLINQCRQPRHHFNHCSIVTITAFDL